MNSIYSSARPLHFASKIFGFLIFSVDFRSNFATKLKSQDFFFIFVAIFANIFMNLIYWLQFFDTTVIGSAVISKSLPIVTFLQYFMCSIVMILSFVKRREFSTILRKFHEIDTTLRDEFSTKFNYHRDKRTLINIVSSTLFAFAIVIICCGIIEAIKRKKVNAKDEIYIFWCLCSTSIILMNFIAVIYAVKVRFGIVNGVLRCKKNIFVEIKFY